MNAQDPADSIHGVLKYINFNFELSYSFLIPTVPFLYIIPTMKVMWKVFTEYHSQPTNLAKMTLDGHLFTLLMLYFVANIAFFFTDLLRFNIPSSGLITSWCASISPNKLFICLIMAGDYINYCILVLPFLVSLIRIIILKCPYNQNKIRALVMKWFIIPVLFLVPLISVSFMIPSIGYCRQLGAPFTFGAVDIYYTRGLFGLRRSYFILSVSVSCWTLSAILSCFMYFQIRTGLMYKASAQTRKLARKAELSISVTLISAIVPFITNIIVAVAAIWTPDIVFYFAFVRLIGNDIETVFMPWLLFLTHPVFREKRENSKKTQKIIQVWKVSQRSIVS